jgi:branched-chain amino acid transport system ATP-binding protein
MTLLCLDAIHVAYGFRKALHGVSLSVGKGEIVALVGGNGAGKSTTLRAIMGLTRPVAGSISLNGERIDGLSPPEIVSRRIALSPEGRRVFPQMSVQENLSMGSYLQSERRGNRQRLERVFEYFPRLRERVSQTAGSLSGGEQQMLAIGRALMAHPMLLLLDEPSLGLAPVRVQEIASVITEINRKEAMSIVLVEQNANLALALCHRAYVIENGLIALSGTGSELARSNYVRNAYLGI